MIFASVKHFKLHLFEHLFMGTVEVKGDLEW